MRFLKISVTLLTRCGQSARKTEKALYLRCSEPSTFSKPLDKEVWELWQAEDRSQDNSLTQLVEFTVRPFRPVDPWFLVSQALAQWRRSAFQSMAAKRQQPQPAIGDRPGGSCRQAAALPGTAAGLHDQERKITFASARKAPGSPARASAVEMGKRAPSGRTPPPRRQVPQEAYSLSHVLDRPSLPDNAVEVSHDRTA